MDVPKQPETPIEVGTDGILVNQWILIGALAGVFLLLLIIILAVRRRRKKKALMADMGDSQEDVPILPELSEEQEDEREREILVPEEDRGAELRESVRDFAEQNPEISAQLLKTWLNGGNNNDN